MDQVVLGLTVLETGMRWRQLSGSHNYAFVSSKPERYTRDDLASAKVLHYHDCMRPDQWQHMLAALEHTHPQVHARLGPLGPLRDPAAALQPVAPQRAPHPSRAVPPRVLPPLRVHQRVIWGPRR
jgi:hypothetical protein